MGAYPPLMIGLILVTIACAEQPTQETSAPTSEAVIRTFRREFIKITPGQNAFPARFRRGAGESARDVTLRDDFEISRYEVTQELWQAVMGTNPSRWKGPRNSVEMLSFAEATQFCQRVTKAMRQLKLIQSDQSVRLPTETQWEYSARAGTQTVFSFGDDPEVLPRYGWFHGNASGNDPPVGAKQPNGWGLYDVHGYLWEWCRTDAKANTLPKATLPKAVVRGGSWKSEAEECTSAARRVVDRQLRDDAIGLRCVLVTELSR